MVKIILVSHGRIASEIYQAAIRIMPECKADVFIVDNIANEDICSFEQRLATLCAQFRESSEVLILTDVCGATPDNLVKKRLDNFNLASVSGLNLPMLLKVLNYRERKLEELVKLAFTGGSENITIRYGHCHANQTNHS